MVWKALTDGLTEALKRAGLDGPGRLERLELAIPREPAHGDWTTNLALALARELGQPPRKLAESLARAYPLDPNLFDRVEVAGPGFLNFHYSRAFVEGLAARVLAEGVRFGRSGGDVGPTIMVEYVSANPTGPLNVVSARAAAVGATLIRLLQATGHHCVGEFYINDAGNQVDLLGASLAARFAERIGVPRELPEGGYQGEYLRELAAELPEPEARRALGDPSAGAWFRDQALDRMVASQQRDLAAYGADFACWFRESTLHESGAVGETLAELKARDMTYRAVVPEIDRNPGNRGQDAPAPGAGEEATWLRTGRFGDDKDRVIVRSNGVPTYLLPDIAYHRDKRVRGNRHAINLWGPDHHAYVGTLKAALSALGLEDDFLEILIVQQVNLLRGGQPVKMSKRAGEFVTLRDLIDEVGADCAKFFFLMRSTSAHLDFDLDLAKRQNDENPAYYVQYAHARIASVLRYASERGLRPAESVRPGALDQPQEIALARRLAMFPVVVRGAAMSREPQRIPSFLVETAAEFHRFYHACRVVSDDVERSRERLLLAEAARQVLANGLALMGVTAPDRMERFEETAA